MIRFTGINKLTSAQSKKKIKENTNEELFPYLLFYEGDKSYKEALNFEKKDESTSRDEQIPK